MMDAISPTELRNHFQNIENLIEKFSNFVENQAFENRNIRTPKQPLSDTALGNNQNTRPSVSSTESLFAVQEKREVFVYLIMKRMVEIDTRKDCFNAIVFVHAKWHENKLDHLKKLNLKYINLNEYWNPNIYIENAIDIERDNLERWAIKQDNLVFIVETQIIRGFFKQVMNLRWFPCDTQELSIVLTSSKSRDHVIFVEDPNHPSSIAVKGFRQPYEWKLYKAFKKNFYYIEEDAFNKKVVNHAFVITCIASRKPGFYIWNFYFVMFFISGLTFLTFSPHPVNVHSRIQLSFILLLTSVTFKFAINQLIPSNSYLTFLDVYIIFAFVMMCSVSIWHALIINISSTHRQMCCDEFAMKADIIALSVLIVTYSSFNIIYAIVFLLKKKNEMHLVIDTPKLIALSNHFMTSSTVESRTNQRT